MASFVLSVRLTEEERALLEAAESEILERRTVTIPAKDWDVFEAWATQPPQEIAALGELARRPPTWQK